MLAWRENERAREGDSLQRRLLHINLYSQITGTSASGAVTCPAGKICHLQYINLTQRCIPRGHTGLLLRNLNDGLCCTSTQKSIRRLSIAYVTVRMRNKEHGATLIELLVGLTIGLLTISVGLGAIMMSRGVTTTVSDTTTLQQQASYAFRVIGQQLRQAGGRPLNARVADPRDAATFVQPTAISLSGLPPIAGLDNAHSKSIRNLVCDLSTQVSLVYPAPPSSHTNYWIPNKRLPRKQPRNSINPHHPQSNLGKMELIWSAQTASAMCNQIISNLVDHTDSLSTTEIEHSR